jgi:hypothetical protein
LAATRKVDELAAASKALLDRRKAARGMGVKGADLFKALTQI